MKRKNGKLSTLLLLLIFIGSILAIFYPFLSNWMFEHRQEDQFEVYERESKIEDHTAEFQEAQAYNQELASGKVELQDPFAETYSDADEERYDNLLQLNHTDIMAYLEIPVISVKIPVYHGTETETLEKGVGHLKATSLPVGGESTHTVLTGHTGLSNARIFTDLTRMKEGDFFFLTVYDRKLAYQVDQIKVVEPTDTSDLTIRSGEDLCTLVTCTPYGINSHRLLVRGVRTEYVENMEQKIIPLGSAETQWMVQYRRSIVIAMITLAGILLLYGILDRVFRKKKERKKNG